MKTIAKALFPQALLLLPLIAATMATSARAQSVASDNFDSASSPSWGDDDLIGHGQLARTGGHLEYLVTKPDLVNGDEAYRPWALDQPSFDSDWEIVVDVHNQAAPLSLGQVVTFGIGVYDGNNTDNYCYVELYASRLRVPALRRGFKADLALNGDELGENTALGDSSDLGVTDGSLRLTFHSGTKVLTAWFDRSAGGNGYQWEKLGSFGITGSGGTTTNANWGMKAGDEFNVALYGYSLGMTVAAGQVYGDNFRLQTPPSPRPALEAGRVAGGLQIRWPDSAVSYSLESNAALAAGAWTSVPQIPDSSNGVNTVVMPVEAGTRYFRLRR